MKYPASNDGRLRAEDYNEQQGSAGSDSQQLSRARQLSRLPEFPAAVIVINADGGPPALLKLCYCEEKAGTKAA